MIGSESHLVVWETATGRRLLSRPYYEPGPLVARFADDESALYAIPGERESIDSSLMRVSMPRGAVEVAPGCWRGPRFTTIELTADGRSATLSCWGGVAIFQAGPLRRTFRTPNLPRPRGPTYCGTFIPPVQTSFALGGRVVLIAEAMPFGHGAVAIRRVRDNAVLMRGTLPESPEDATTWLTSDTRVAVLLDSPSGPRLFDMRSNGSRTRNLTPDEAAFTVVPPELVEMPSAAAPPDAPSARAALDAQVCHAGELVIPREMCP